jgi:copper(I)-binding protein
VRIQLPAAFGATLVALVGAAGLIRGAQPLSGTAATPSAPAEPIVVSGAYIRAPAPPTDAAAAYFTVYNTGSTADRLTGVVSGAGASTVLHITTQGTMVVNAAGVLIPAHAKLVLKAGQGHVMIEQLFGTLTAGQTVSLELTFEKAGVIDVTAPVIALGAPAPSNGGS